MDAQEKKIMSDLVKDVIVRKFFDMRLAEREGRLAQRIRNAVKRRKRPILKSRVIDAFDYIESKRSE